ncbi:tRNA pseudouridine synthase A [Lachnospiraceae bacterium TWA4]|nr:tRNA pseudouridine synthase A [Lachnospiraceae bacterium TWA4]
MYDGSRYYGWQRLKNKETIQGKIESVLAKMCGVESIEINGAGRTDAGVHAKAMVANVFLDTSLSPEEIRNYLNTYLPNDICILEVRIASMRFHARYNAIGKTYCYTCYIGDTKPVFERKYVTILEKKPNIELMQKASTYLLGTHDFHNFCGNTKMKKSTIRTVNQISIEQEEDFLQFRFHGNGFLQNMVRILVGTLLEIGYEQMSLEELVDVLESGERKKAGPTALAQGLCLESIDY